MTAPLIFWWLQDWNQMLVAATKVVVPQRSESVVTVPSTPPPLVVTVGSTPTTTLTV